MPTHDAFQVESIDHVELLAPDRYEAAAWYETVFGLKIVPQLEGWCEPHGGPLMVSSDGGRTMLALFRGEAKEQRADSGPRLIGFRVNAAGFLAFVDRAASLDTGDGNPLTITRDSVHDRGHVCSVYLDDPWGNRFAVTTYDVKAVRDALAEPLERGFDG